jgi:hypothetical protein
MPSNYLDLSQLPQKISNTTHSLQQITQSTPYENNHLFTDPKLL